jgi:23S rRNA (cytidine2498-2'-O)-methyltransferase
LLQLTLLQAALLHVTLLQAALLRLTLLQLTQLKQKEKCLQENNFAALKNISSPYVEIKGKVYKAARGFESHLENELKELYYNYEKIGDLYSALDSCRKCEKDSLPFWVQNVWLKPFKAEFTSISRAAKILKNIQRNWAASLFTRFRRGALIKEKLPKLCEKPRTFPWFPPHTPVGSWTLLDENTLLASSECLSPFPNGVIEFAQNRICPPSRAYLKLWEAFSRFRKSPKQNEICLDAGATPGSWSWALARLNTKVISVDRAPLDERILSLPNVTFVKHDAFTLKPKDIGPVDWLFCDVICYPPRLLTWIEKWLEEGLCKNFICTIKMQGKPDMQTVRRFASIENSNVTHLYHNKHELTWVKLQKTEN